MSRKNLNVKQPRDAHNSTAELNLKNHSNQTNATGSRNQYHTTQSNINTSGKVTASGYHPAAHSNGMAILQGSAPNVPLSVKNNRSMKDGKQQDSQLLSSKIAAFNFHATSGNNRSKQ